MKTLINSNTKLATNYDTSIKIKENKSINYDVIFNEYIFNSKNQTIKSYCGTSKLLIVISETIRMYYMEEILNYFTDNFNQDQFKIITIKTTESHKNMDNVLRICDEGRKFNLDRRSLLIAIGGGVLMDIVGFAASMYKRQISYLRIPTTLVGQIDAGVGIKTGINFGNSKNFIGAYHPPVACINDITLLKTLRNKDILCGLAEIIKMAIIKDKYLFELLENHSFSLINHKYQHDKNLSSEVNYLAANKMIEELSGNLHELCLERLVDFGHTFSPFIEEYSNFSIEHGLAVALDIAISTEIAFILGDINEENRNRILQLLLNIGLDIYDDQTYKVEPMHDSLLKILLHRGMKLNLVIPTKIGEAKFIKNPNEIDDKLLQFAFDNLEKFQFAFRKEQ